MQIPCPLLRHDKNGVARFQWVREANRLCGHPDHRYLDALHVPVEVELERLGMSDKEQQ
jgi:hypothetical protein